MTMNIAIKEEEEAGKEIMRFFGVLKSVNWDSRKKEMTALRREFEERL